MAIPERAYDRLQNLWRRLGLSQEDMYYAIENDQLRTAVWMPMRYMERGVIKDGKFVFVRHECREGFIRELDRAKLTKACLDAAFSLKTQELDEAVRAEDDNQPSLLD